MSGSSGGGGGGGDFDSSPDRCSDLVLNTQLSSPREAVVAQLSVGDVMDVAVQTMVGTSVVVALWQGQIAGGLASPALQRLRECIEAGNEYEARVTVKNDGQIRVQVKAKGP